jgi:dienelactone hydrolase
VKDKYKVANHGIFKDTTRHYDEAASEKVWAHTLDWIAQYAKA